MGSIPRHIMPLAINSIGANTHTSTHTHTHTDIRTETMLRYQACASLQKACTDFKKRYVHVLTTATKRKETRNILKLKSLFIKFNLYFWLIPAC